MGIIDMTQTNLVMATRVTVLDNGVEIIHPVTIGTDNQVIGPQALVRDSTVSGANAGVLNKCSYQNVHHTNTDWYLTSRAKEDCKSYLGSSTTTNYGNGWSDRIPDCPFILYGGSRPLDIVGTLATTPAAKTRNEIRIPYYHIDQFGQFPEFPVIEAGGDLTVNVNFENRFPLWFSAVMPTRFTECLDVAVGAGGFGSAGQPLITASNAGARLATQFVRPPKVGDYVTVTGQDGAARLAPTRIAAVTVSTTPGPTLGAYSIVLETPLAPTGPNPLTRVVLYYGDFGPYDSRACYPSANVTSDGASNIGSATSPLVITNFWGGANNGSASYNRDCPFYVGCPVGVTGANGINTIGGASRGGFTTVASLSRNGTNLLITLNTPVPVGAVGANITNVRIAHRDYSSANGNMFQVTANYDQLYLELPLIQTTPSKMEQLRKDLANSKMSFLEYSVEPQQMATGVTYERTWQVQPNCLGWHLITPQTNTLVSGYDTVNGYSIDVQGEPLLNVPFVPVGNIDNTSRSLANMLTRRYFNNMQMPLAKYDAQATNYRGRNDNTTHGIITCMTPVVPYPQTVKLLLQTNGTPFTTKTGYYVHYFYREIQFSNGSMKILR